MPDKEFVPTYAYSNKVLELPEIVKPGLDFYIDTKSKKNRDMYGSKFINLAKLNGHSKASGVAMTEENGFGENGIQFDGINDHIELMGIKTLGKSFTIEMVLGVDEETDGTLLLFNTKGGYIVVSFLNGFLGLYHLGILLDGITVPPGTATVSFWVDKGDVRLYVDGVEKGKTVGPVGADTGDVIYGAFGLELPDEFYYNGKFMALRKYGRALTEEEILENYNDDKMRWT